MHHGLCLYIFNSRVWLKTLCDIFVQFMDMAVLLFLTNPCKLVSPPLIMYIILHIINSL